ncbi:MAG: glycosyltransferase [Planctomycetia bacterium]|nr:glycosyltransferase [Planctomycetia bacterium]
MKNPKISIIIPVYNVEKYLRECLNSVVNQTIQEIEIICVNDGSTDGSAAILEEYAAKDKRIQILTQENGGLSVARNAGMDVAKGEYVAFVDSDDYIDLQLYERVYTKAIVSDAEMTVFFFYRIENSQIVPGYSMLGISPFPITEECEKIKTILHSGNSACSILYKNSFLKENNLRFVPGLIWEDNVFNSLSAYKANKIVFCFERGYYYRQRPGSTTQCRSNHFKWLETMKTFFDNFQGVNLQPETRLFLSSYKLKQLYESYHHLPLFLKRSFAKKVFEIISSEELKLLENFTLDVNAKVRCFYLSMRPTSVKQFIFLLKYWKNVSVDYFVTSIYRMLLRHSCYLQKITQNEEKQVDSTIAQWRNYADEKRVLEVEYDDVGQV